MGAPIDRRSFLAQTGAVVLGGALPAAAGARAPRRGTPIPRTLKSAMRGPVISPGNPAYVNAAHVYNLRFDGLRPRAIARPLDSKDVIGAVRWAVGHDVGLRARSGGHSYAGYSTCGPNEVVLDLRELRHVSVDRRAGTATVAAGAQLIDVYAALARYGATIPGGSCPSVGISGVTLGGGMGLAGRAMGLTCDSLIGARIVTADGKLRTVNRRTDPDLLWALRGGGGGNFGIVVDFTFKLHPIPRAASYFFVSWPWSSASAALAAWQAWAPHARSQLTSIFHLEGAAGLTRARVSGQYLGPSRDLAGLLGPLRGASGAQISTGSLDYLGLQLLFAGCSGLSVSQCHTGRAPNHALDRLSFDAKSDYVTRPLSSAARGVLVRAAEQRAGQPGSGALLFDAYGGAINRLGPGQTAFVHRNALFCIQYLSYNGGSSWLRETHNAMRRYVSGQAYQNYIDAGLSHWQQAYYGSNYKRLQATRKRVDPEHRFNFPQAIGRR